MVKWLEPAQERLPKPSVLVPIPLHRSRERSRGYNQSRVLAKLLAQRTGHRVVDGLVRTKATVTQTGLDRSARRKNVRDAFKWSAGPVPPSVILVDDVYTTGATMDAAAQACRTAGIRRVHGLVVAKR